jgi:hypothetical protein
MGALIGIGSSLLTNVDDIWYSYCLYLCAVSNLYQKSTPLVGMKTAGIKYASKTQCTPV